MKEPDERSTINHKKACILLYETCGNYESWVGKNAKRGVEKENIEIGEDLNDHLKIRVIRVHEMRYK